MFAIKLDCRKVYQLLIGVLGIYIAFLYSGVKYEKIVSQTYVNQDSKASQRFRITAGFMMVQRCINWLCGLVYYYITIPKQTRVQIPKKNSISTSGLIYLSSVITTQSMYYVSYPFVIISKSCSLISVILVGVFCSRVRSKQLKLQGNKIIITLIVTIGIVLFRVFDPQVNLDDNKQTSLLGIVLIIIGLFIDGFIPDFQAQIKEKYKPQPIEMLISLNKWAAIWGFVHIIVTNQFFDFVKFCITFPTFFIDLLLLSLATFLGQIFVYRMIKQFKQHIVPFVITTRKIVTVGLSIILFSHPYSTIQIISLLIVLSTTLYEFVSSVSQPPPGSIQIKQKQKQNQIQYDKIESQTSMHEQSIELENNKKSQISKQNQENIN